MNDANDPMEELLSRYRPAGPTADLRQRVLQNSPAGQAMALLAWGVWTFRGAVAAAILLALALIVSAERTEQSYLSQIGLGSAQLTEQDEGMSDLFGGDGWAGRCMAGGLITGSLRDYRTNTGDRQ